TSLMRLMVSLQARGCNVCVPWPAQRLRSRGATAERRRGGWPGHQRWGGGRSQSHPPGPVRQIRIELILRRNILRYRQRHPKLREDPPRRATRHWLRTNLDDRVVTDVIEEVLLGDTHFIAGNRHAVRESCPLRIRTM